jgi:hypothetical protein
MPMELQIIRAADFMRLGPTGSIDLEASRRYLKELARACRRRGVSRALVDVRGLVPKPKPQLSPGDLESLVDCFTEMGFRESDRLAILYSRDPHHGARTFAFLGSLQGWNVEAFSDFESALNWLSENSDDDERVRMGRHGAKITHRTGNSRNRKQAAEDTIGIRRALLLKTNSNERSRKDPRRA